MWYSVKLTGGPTGFQLTSVSAVSTFPFCRLTAENGEIGSPTPHAGGTPKSGAVTVART